MEFMNNKFPIKSLLRELNTGRWYPKSVETFRAMLSIPPYREFNSYVTSKNIAYNLQYLEFLQKQIDELALSEVLCKMVIKNYIIIAMGIIEGLFVYLLKSTGNWNQSQWKIIQKNNIDNSKPIIIEGKTLKIRTEVYEKVDNYDIEMQFDAIISKVKSKNLLELQDNKVYDLIAKYKKLRNKVHLHIAQFGTDYSVFDISQQKLIKRLLLVVLANKQFCSDTKNIREVYDFLIDEDKQ